MAKILTWLTAAATLLAFPLAAATANCVNQVNPSICCTCIKTCSDYEKDFSIKNQGLYERLRGQIILRVQGNGEAYYVSATTGKLIYLGQGQQAFDKLVNQSAGISNATLRGLLPGVTRPFGADSDLDGLTDNFETAIGTKPLNFNSDQDRFSDFTEISNGFDPLGVGSWPTDYSATKKLAGRILLQVESHGESWYVNPKNGKRYLFSNQYDTAELIKTQSTGVTNYTFDLLTR